MAKGTLCIAVELAQFDEGNLLITEVLRLIIVSGCCGSTCKYRSAFMQRCEEKGRTGSVGEDLLVDVLRLCWVGLGNGLCVLEEICDGGHDG